ncbi:MAG: DUF4349 domain-containing protein, partial [Actinobacteria bacterium]
MIHRRITAVGLVLAMVAVVTVAPLAGCQSLSGNRGQSEVAPQPDGSANSGTTADKSPALVPEGSTESRSSSQSESGGTGTSPAVTKPMIVRDKTLTMEVDSIRTTLAKINALSAKYKASITQSSISSPGGDGVLPTPEEQRSGSGRQDGNGPLSGTVTIKIPVEDFDAYVTAVRKLGDVRSERESTEDVTQQHIDMKARLKNLKAEEAAFLRFFRAAKNVREMLTIEQQLARVRGEIESLQAQIDYLERRSAMATLTLNLSEPGGVVSPSGEDWGFVDAIRQAIRAFVGVVNFLIITIGALLPILILGAIGFFVVRWLLRLFVFAKR